MNIVLSVIFTGIGFCIGSIPWTLLILKYVYKEDVSLYTTKWLDSDYILKNKEHKVWGIICLILNGLKAIVSMALAACFSKDAISFAGVGAIVGQYFSLFTDFKGGKDYLINILFLLGLAIFTESDLIFTFVYPILIFVAVLGLTKYISVSLIVSLIIETVISFLTNESTLFSIEILLVTLLALYKYRTNLYLVFKGKESKIKFLV